MQCLPEEPVENRTGRAGLVGRAHLSEDLALARHHRVETCGNAEEMECCGFVAESVQGGPELGLEREQRRLRSTLRIVGGAVREVELRAIARREADCFA